VPQNRRWYQTVYFKIFLHALAWTAFIVLPFLLRQTVENNPTPNPNRRVSLTQEYSTPQKAQKLYEAMKSQNLTTKDSAGFYNQYFKPQQRTPRSFTIEHIILFNLIPIAFFYLNAYIFMPFLLNRKRLLSYIAVTLIGMTAFAFALYFVRSEIMDFPFTLRFPIFSFFNLLSFLAMSIAYRFVLDKNRFERLQREKETESLKTELSFLRSQVSPHFMFNVLNNIVSLSRTQKDLVEPALIQLSDLMRYMLYESDEEKVTLAREIEYLNNYINLQKMRFGDDINVSITTQGNFDEYLIEPMLLIPFVENSFKHGIGLIKDPFINISVHEHNGVLNFEVTNKFSAQHEIKDKQSGIGLHNVQRRLKLLYPDKHTLVIEKVNDEFVVNLKLELQ
jgi:two-component system, LytTR family, sensor kinase